MEVSRIAVVLVVLAALAGCAGSGGGDHGEMAVAPSVRPFLMFQDGRAEEAMGFYAAAFADGRVVSIERFGPGAPSPEGTVQLGVFEIHGQRVMCSDSPPVHDFDFTPSMSLFVECASEAEMDGLVATLSEGGEFMMPPDDYGFSRKFAFFKDRYGVSWRVNLE